MSPGWRADGLEAWSWNTAQDQGWPSQSATGWGIGDAGWGVTETNVGDANQRDMATAGPTAEQASLGWGNDHGWGVNTASNNQHNAEVERKTSISSTRDPPSISPREEPRRSLTSDLHISVR